MGELRVSLVDYTGKEKFGATAGDYAAAILAFTKNTRLQMTPDGLDAWLRKTREELYAELDYMANTIPSSWEFVDLTFSIENVTRAAAQQITRTRFVPMDGDIFGSYAMQSQRVTDVSSMGFRVPPNTNCPEQYQEIVNAVMETYADMIKHGEEPEDARAILPMNTQCNLLVKYNLRQFVDTVKNRQSLRAQDEYREIVYQMVDVVRAVYPWIDKFLVPKQDAAIKIIEEIAATLPTDQKRTLAKAADLIRKT